MYKILICEDEENIVSFLEAELKFESFEIDIAYDGEEAITLFSQNEYDLILLDIMLPIRNGLECLREFRKTSSVPVIILTARKEVFDKVAFLNAGADDYVTKPFDTLELIARVKRNIKRFKTLTPKESQAKMSLYDNHENIHKTNSSKLPNNTQLKLNKEGYQAYIGDNQLALTKTEFEILLHLHSNLNKVQTREEIIRTVFGDFYGESNIVDANIKNIRAKIANYTSHQVIETVRGKGYVIRI